MRPGVITIQPKGDLPPLSLRTPMPFFGVFALQSAGDLALGEGPKNTLWTWCPWLTEAGGVRWVRGNTHREKVDFGIGSGSGYYVQLPINDDKGALLSSAVFWKAFRRPFEDRAKRDRRRSALKRPGQTRQYNNSDIFIQTPGRMPEVGLAYVIAARQRL